MTVALFDVDGKPVGRATVEPSDVVPRVALWQGRAYVYRQALASGVQYQEVSTVVIPVLRQPPGLA